MQLARSFLPALVLVAGLPFSAGAQVRASEPASVSQTVDGTKLTIEYYRPRLRGRDSVFEKVVFPEKTWTPGANWSTTLEVDKRIRLNGTTVEPGKYGVWFHFQPDKWTLILDRKHRRFHMNPPDSTADAIRMDVVPGRGPATDVLTWGFPELRVNGGKLAMNWAESQVTLDFIVEPSYELTMPQPAARRFVGRYTMAAPTEPGDTTKPEPNRFELKYRNGSLKGKWERPPIPGWDEFILIPIQDTWFILADIRDGEVYDVLREAVFEFDVAGGKATGFTLRGTNDQVWATGTRER